MLARFILLESARRAQPTGFIASAKREAEGSRIKALMERGFFGPARQERIGTFCIGQVG
jgi:hypothetical protein